MTIRFWIAATVAGLSVGMCSYANRPNVMDQIKQDADSRYCDMRQTWEDSDGAYGWPAYDQDLEDGCELVRGDDE